MKEIPLTQGKVTLVDDEDFDYLNQFKWCAKKDKKTYYATREKREGGKPHRIYMHSLIIGTPKGMQTDHINGDGLDNRRKNLRIVTNRENSQNRHQIKSSIYPGVYSRNGKWISQIQIKGKNRQIGTFDNEKAASNAYIFACNHPESLPPIRAKSSKYKGVCWCKDLQRWRARITIGGKQIWIGTFVNETDAALAYQKASGKEILL